MSSMKDGEIMTYGPYPWATNQNTSNNIAQQSEATYLNYNQLKAIVDVGFFLENYVVQGGEVTKDIYRNDTINVTDIVVSLDNDVTQRQGTSFKTKIANTTYYLDYQAGDFTWGTSHPKGSYLPIAEVKTDGFKNVSVITDKRGPIGGFRLRPGYEFPEIAELQEDVAYYTVPERFGGATDSEKIQNALNSDSKLVICKGNYSITSTITVPDNKTLDLTSAVFTINNDVDGVVLRDRSTLKNGKIEIGESVKSTYSRSAVILTNGLFQIINNTLITNYGFYKGTGIKFDVNATAARIAYANLDNFKIQGFNIGLDITVPNVPPHVADSSVDNWITTCKIHGFIADANQAVRLYDASGKGQAIQAMDVLIRGQAGRKNQNFDEAIYARCVQSTFNVILDDAGFDPNLVKNFIVFDKDSHVNTYLGPDEKVVDNGIDNIIINRDGYFKPGYLTKSDQNDARPLGVINNLLFHAHDRFAVTTTPVNCTFFDTNECFKFGNRALSTLYRTVAGQDASLTYNINFGTNTLVRSIAVALNLYGYGEKVRFRAYCNANSTWYDTGFVTSKEHNSVDLLNDLKVSDITKITQIEITVFMGSTYTLHDNIKIEGLFAYGGASLTDKGGLLSRSGGKMYGDLDMNKKTLLNCVLANGSTPNRPTSPSVGQVFYDTTLKKPIWWSGTNWADATGTTV